MLSTDSGVIPPALTNFASELPTEVPKPPYRILLVQSAHGLFESSGGYRANLALLRALSAQGHAVKMIATAYERDIERLPADVNKDKTTFGEDDLIVYRFKWDELEVVALECETFKSIFETVEAAQRRRDWLTDHEEPPCEFQDRSDFIAQEAQRFKPTHFIFNDQITLKTAIDNSHLAACARIFIAHDVQSVPFGPYSKAVWSDCHGTDETDTFRISQILHGRLCQVDALWTVSEAVKQFFETFGNLNPIHVPNHPAIYGDLEAVHVYDNYDAPYVCAINPGVLKGFELFRETATGMPDVKFLAVRSWNTSSFVLDELKKLPNVTISEPKKDMEELWRQVKVLLVPTIFFEAFGLVVVEAMLRGIPVISSDAGGLPEAHLGVPYSIPTNLITGALEKDPTLVEKYGIYKQPEIDLKPWIETLRTLLNDAAVYEDVQRRGREQAVQYIRNLTSDDVYEGHLKDALQRRIVREGGKPGLIRFM
ncbi:hypothetical protein HK097_002679 [Rhizophlyctis rosea]|uniref:Glycosyltransferase family 4 protein n=1 Tax=Rhizophlyctis rosea TaxID=64517 RepID=A0AAD5X426_9FUNG|nr:hypothetical protein HK097_002679 [Rhizophlyctis rosea]